MAAALRMKIVLLEDARETLAHRGDVCERGAIVVFRDRESMADQRDEFRTEALSELAVAVGLTARALVLVDQKRSGRETLPRAAKFKTFERDGPRGVDRGRCTEAALPQVPPSRQESA